MKRELVPELDDQEYWRIVSGLRPAEEEAIFEPRSLPADRATFEAEESFGPASERHMFRALITALAEESSPGIRTRLEAHSTAGCDFTDPGLSAGLTDQLADRLADLYLRPLVRHLRETSLRGELTATTPESRYQQYCSQWWERSAAQFAAAYPVLTHLDVRVREQFLNNLDLTLRRVHHHREQLAALMNVPGAALELRAMDVQGDRHNGGQAACILTFTRGAAVYKPRSVAGEWAYRRIDEWLARRGASSGRAAAVIRGEGYGFMEFMEHQPVDLDDEQFLERTGEMAAVLHALQTNDLHFENVFNRGGEPVPIDLETIMHPVDILTEDDPRPAQEGNAYQVLAMGIGASGLLPSRVEGKDGQRGYLDVGFLGTGSTGTPFAGLVVNRPFRDDAHVAFTPATAPPLADADVEQTRAGRASTAAAVARGFSRRYRWITRNREEFTRAAMMATTDSDLRVVLQPTMRYAQLLRMMASPEALASWEVFRTVSLRTVVFGSLRPLALAESEARSLRHLDVPFFTASSTRTHLHDGDGAPVGLRLAATPQEVMRAKIAAMGEPDLQAQLVQIWSSFVSGIPANTLPAWGRAPRDGARGPWRELAADLADHLVATMHPGSRPEDPWTWVAPVPGTISERSSWETQALAPDTYSGALGPALALAAFSRLTGAPRYRDAARRVLDPVAQYAYERDPGPPFTLDQRDSVFLGDAGAALVLKTAGRYLGLPEYLEASRTLADGVVTRIGRAGTLTPDFLTGHVGAIATVLGHRLTTAPGAALVIVERHVHDVLAGDRPGEWWEQSGFAHGVSGSLFLVSRWADSLNDPAAAHAAVRVLAERLEDFYDPRLATWLSRTDGSGRQRSAWCHGSTGIALGLSAARGWSPSTALPPGRLRTAVEHSIRHGLGRNLTLCHGDLGTLETLRWIAATTGDDALAARVRQRSRGDYPAERLERALSDRSNRYSLTPSLMVGTSGVLHWLTGALDPTTRLPLPIIPDALDVV